MPAEEEDIMAKLTPKQVENSYKQDQDVLLNQNSLLLEVQLNPPAIHLVNSVDLSTSGGLYRTGGLFDSIIDFDLDKDPSMTIEAKSDRMMKMIVMLKSERLKLSDLLKQIDNERTLFRKLNQELIKLVVDLKTDEACVNNKPLKSFVDRAFSLNYELLKKTVLRLEDKILNSEKELDEYKKKFEDFESKNAQMKKVLYPNPKRIEIEVSGKPNQGFMLDWRPKSIFKQYQPNTR